MITYESLLFQYMSNFCDNGFFETLLEDCFQFIMDFLSTCRMVKYIRMCWQCHVFKYNPCQLLPIDESKTQVFEKEKVYLNP